MKKYLSRLLALLIVLSIAAGAAFLEFPFLQPESDSGQELILDHSNPAPDGTTSEAASEPAASDTSEASTAPPSEVTEATQPSTEAAPTQSAAEASPTPTQSTTGASPVFTRPSAEPEQEQTEAATSENTTETDGLPDLNGSYTTMEDVALYIHIYGCLPPNFMTKSEARALGWSGGSLEPYAPGMCIGGDRFQNREGLLPKASERCYTECDIDTMGADSRGAKRIVFSDDGLIYYTEDHYESFELLYGEP